MDKKHVKSDASAGQSVLLIIGGGIAAYKCLELIRRLQDENHVVTVVMTKAAHEFVTQLSVSTLARGRLYEDLFDARQEMDVGHIRLSRQADLVVVAPATADLMAKLAHGLANDLGSATLLANTKPLLMAPAMNPAMWSNPATQRNFQQLLADGVQFIGPERGEMAEAGEAGLGRMSEPETILAAITEHFTQQSMRGGLNGKRVLITAGPTHEPIDPVRYIANRSSGKQGFAIAAAAQKAGAHVTLVSGPVHLDTPAGVERVDVESARDMLAAVEGALPADIAICAAAVADWRPAQIIDQKQKKTSDGAPPAWQLTENPDILRFLSQETSERPGLVVGFAAETENVIAHASAKRQRKGCDWLVANNVGAGSEVMGGDENTIHLLTDDGVEDWPKLPKSQVAERLVQRLIAELNENGRGA